MPRAPRIHYPGAIYHVMARGVDGREVFVDDHDRRSFILTLLRLKSETPFSILAYCLMNNHFHIALRVSQTPLQKLMHRLLTGYVVRFNSRHSRQGHLFQARYKACLCLNDRYLVSLIPYIHMNPVRAGMVSAPIDWPWSSFRDYLGTSTATIADDALYRHTLGNSASPDVQDPLFEPWPEAECATMLVRSDSGPSESIDEIALNSFPEYVPEIRSGSRKRALTPKKLIIAEKALQNGHSLASIAAWMNCGPSAIHRLLQTNK